MQEHEKTFSFASKVPILFVEIEEQEVDGMPLVPTIRERNELRRRRRVSQAHAAIISFSSCMLPGKNSNPRPALAFFLKMHT